MQAIILAAGMGRRLGEYPSGMRVNSLLASKCWGVKEDYILPGNGASELISAIMRTLEGRMGIVRPTFEEYPNRLDDDRVISFVPQDPDFRYGSDELKCFFSDKKVKTLLLINPDNPSGNFIPLQDVLDLAEWCAGRDMRLIVDESFVDFSDDGFNSSLLDNSYLESHSNIIVIKSISKSYGVPGLRLGIMASADRTFLGTVKKELSIWNINSFAEFFMQIFNKYEKDYRKACAKFIEIRSEFLQELEGITFLRPMPTQANFVLCEVKPPFTADGVARVLLNKYNILVSSCDAKKGMAPNRYIRLAIRKTEDNSRLIQALKAVPSTTGD